MQKRPKSSSYDKLTNLGGYDNQHSLGPSFKDDEGNILKIGFQSDYFDYDDNYYTSIVEVFFRGQRGKSKRWEIQFNIPQKTGSGLPPTVIGFYFNGNGNYYSKIKNRILNPADPIIIRDGQLPKPIKIPIINKD